MYSTELINEARSFMFRLLKNVFDNGGSDLFISADFPPSMKHQGLMKPLSSQELSADKTKLFAHSIMNDKQREEFERELECNFAISIPDVSRFRVNIFQQQMNVGMVIRTITSEIPNFTKLKLPPSLKDVIMEKRGLILVVGGTGSGKSTTLSAMLDYINGTRYEHILPIEDPIEFVHPSKKCLINQRELHRNTHSFSAALRSALREDPDIILVGELRDLETIRLALTAAETGHLVFATLHTTSAAKTIDRIIDVFPSEEKGMIRAMLSESLQAVIAQVLLKKNGGGRVAVHEIMLGIPAIRNLIRENKIAQMYSAIQTGAQHGMITLDQSLKNLINDNLINADIARTVAKQPDSF